MVIVLSIFALVTSVIIASTMSARSKSRDAERVAMMNQVVLALEQYYEKNRQYPLSDNAGCGGWDTPGNGTFIQALKTQGFLTNDIKDPKGDGDCGNYRYYRYDAGYYGCPPVPFYVLGIVDLERTTGKAKDSPGWACGSLDWQPGMEWVTGQFQ